MESEEIKEEEVEEHPQKKTYQQEAEDQLDWEFFEKLDSHPPPKGKKLTKAQKRALKFAEKKGQDPTEVDLEEAGPKTKKKHKTEFKGYGVQAPKQPKGNKFSHFTEMDLDSHTNT